METLGALSPRMNSDSRAGAAYFSLISPWGSNLGVVLAVLHQHLDSVTFQVLSNLNDSIPGHTAMSRTNILPRCQVLDLGAFCCIL